jgi:hypothetical protein
VADVFVAGKQVVRGRKCITVDIAAAAEEAQKRAQILGQTIRP